jgi:hypothetical protein
MAVSAAKIGVDDKGEYSERRIFKGKFDGNGFIIE